MSAIADGSTAATARAPRSHGATSAGSWIEEIRDAAALEALVPEWDALSARSEDALLFNGSSWVRACLRHPRLCAGSGAARPLVLALRDSLSLQAVLPLCIETRELLGWRTRIVRFIGEGPSDYADALIAGPRQGAAEAFVAHLDRMRGWDLIELRECRGDSPNVRLLEAAMRGRGWQVAVTDDSPCQLIPAQAQWAEYCRTHVSAKRIRDQRRQWRALEAAGAVAVDWHTAVDCVPALVDEMADVQADRSFAGPRSGEFNDPVFRPFLEGVLQDASREGRLRLATLRQRGRLIAYWLAFLYRGRYYLYNTAHRHGEGASSAGRLLMMTMLERMMDERGGVIDYLRGAESYKDAWTEQSVVNVRLRAARNGVRAAAARAAWFRALPALARRSPRMHHLLLLASERGVGRAAGYAWQRLTRRRAG